MNQEAITKQFLEQYYGTMMQNKMGIVNFYTNNSTMTYGGSTYRGLKDIGEKI